jgi:hypothetical protein
MDNPKICSWIVFAVLLLLIIIFDKKYSMLRDSSLAQTKPYSFARVQLAWWTLIVLSEFITILIIKAGAIPTLNNSTLILLGISAGTTATARVIDLSDQSNPAISRNQDMNGDNFILDILSDANGVNIHRFQTVVFNLIFGIWFIIEFLSQASKSPACPVCSGPNADAAACAACTADFINHLIPVITTNNLILLGLSSATYAALKTTENKDSTGPNQAAPAPEALLPDEANNTYQAAQG